MAAADNADAQPAAGPSLTAEYQQQQMIRNELLRYIVEMPHETRGRAIRRQREAKNALGAWLMAQQFEYRDIVVNQPYPLLPDTVRVEDNSTRKLISTLTEKFVIGDEDATTIANELIDRLNAFRRRNNEQRRQLVRYQHTDEGGGRIIVGNFSTPSVSSLRIGSLVEAFGLDQTAKMVLRYDNLELYIGAEVGDPITVFNAMYELGDARYEAFASPLNARLLGRPDAKFCSLFHDTDAAFGSMGNFFSINLSDHPGGWIVNPPWIETILEAAAQRIVDYVSEADDCWFFVNMPQWRDTPAWPLLDECEFKRDRIDSPAHQYLMQNFYGGLWEIQTPYCIFIIGHPPKEVDLQALRPLLGCRNRLVVERDWQEACDRVAAIEPQRRDR